MAVLWCGRIPAGLLVTVVARGARQQADDNAGRHEDPGGDESHFAALRTRADDWSASDRRSVCLRLVVRGRVAAAPNGPFSLLKPP
jgi:hypothetical protein